MRLMFCNELPDALEITISRGWSCLFNRVETWKGSLGGSWNVVEKMGGARMVRTDDGNWSDKEGKKPSIRVCLFLDDLAFKYWNSIGDQESPAMSMSFSVRGEHEQA